MTRLEMIKTALKNFSEPTDTTPYLFNSFYPHAEIGGGITSVILLQSLLNEQEYNALASRLYNVTGFQGILPAYGDWITPTEFSRDITLEFLYEELEPILAAQPANV